MGVGGLNETAKRGRVALGGASNWPLDGNGDRERDTHSNTHMHILFCAHLLRLSSLI